MANIHPTAIVEDGAVIHEAAEIGPFCVIGPEVSIGSGTVLKSHVAVAGKTSLGVGCTVYPFASLGHAPQDLKFHGEASEVQIGDNVVIREHVTINPGTEGGGLLTRVGNNCLLMIGAHVAHDCLIGNNVILVNNATLGGHVEIDDFAIIGGLSAVHQFVRIGEHAMIGGASGVETDIIPFGSATGNRATLQGLNLTGLKRRNFPREEIHALRKAYKELFADEGTFQARVADVQTNYPDSTLVGTVLDFINGETKRGFCQPE
ncbi:acyl-ACP--UDP-N-acetylglucosamine O-acyltransferase [Sneathiella chinensis]|uniref:Acyl-[acyl-carrier-protein]--UDP-N-acetylglucosamine O-acyltransferase n=1 Tax=Sneathiella chinensis TaxID=349750 RepID=A0ABQ5U5Q5_9PROT|nr:acyl-ACP--UDP-N-acetylglucosamine O-acyltransferase [Sneathiella chinensis]GLQ07208.1 acyl-[acyl-carrier-protein]--UDP-N-acetylglucosamine O-acyltransferase [Sneathiella chinensis]